MSICGPTHPAVDLPDASGGTCCYGAAIYGPQRCTCWQPVHDVDQTPIRPGVPMPPIPVRMCHDCAYRRRSPERTGAVGYAADADVLDDLVAGRMPFFCHQGMRRVLTLRHPTGFEVPAHPGAYDPPIVNGVPYRADGSPALLCAGWLLRAAHTPSNGASQ